MCYGSSVSEGSVTEKKALIRATTRVPETALVPENAEKRVGAHSVYSPRDLRETPPR